MALGANAPGVSPAFATSTNGVSSGRVLNLPKPEQPSLLLYRYLEHCSRNRKGPGRVPAPPEVAR